MDIRETLNRQDYTKLDEFSKQLEGFEGLFADKDLLKMRQELAKINKDEVVGLCSEINGYKTGFMDALTLLDSETDLQAFKELFEKWWIDYEFDQRINALLDQYPYTNFEERTDYKLKVEYKTRPRKEVTIIITNDLDTSSKSELKKLTILTKREYCYGKSFEGW